MPQEVPQGPWQKVGADLFQFAGKHFLVVVDYFSKYPEVIRVPGLAAKHIVDALKPTFARHGIPQELMADNMPFASAELKIRPGMGISHHNIEPYVCSLKWTG